MALIRHHLGVVAVVNDLTPTAHATCTCNTHRFGRLAANVVEADEGVAGCSDVLLTRRNAQAVDLLRAHTATATTTQTQQPAIKCYTRLHAGTCAHRSRAYAVVTQLERAVAHTSGRLPKPNGLVIPSGG